VVANILVFHLTMDRKGIPQAAVTAVCWLILFWAYRQSFAPLWKAKAEPKA
jgi:hypothetical protein